MENATFIHGYEIFSSGLPSALEPYFQDSHLRAIAHNEKNEKFPLLTPEF